MSLVAAVLTACGPVEKPDVDGVPDQLVQESRQFQTSSGLFVAPEAGNNSTGTVEATYLFARLLDARFSEVASDATKDALFQAAGSADAPTWGRLMAAAALRRAGDARWEGFEDLATSTFDSLPTTISRADLGTYIVTMDPILMLSAVSPKAKLAVFDAQVGNDADEKDALAVLNRSYLFANQGEIDGSFVQIQNHLALWVQSDTTAVPKLIAAADALPVARRATITDEVRHKASESVASLRGCLHAKLFIPVSRDKDAGCSIAFTEAARGIEGSMEVEEQ